MTLPARIDTVADRLRLRSCACALDFPEELRAISGAVRALEARLAKLEAREQARLSKLAPGESRAIYEHVAGPEERFPGTHTQNLD